MTLNTKILETLNSIPTGQFFTLTFTKRNSDEVRVMNCRTNVKKHTKGGSLRYNPTAYDLISVWDPKAHAEKGNGYRQVPLEGITEIKAQGKVWNFL